MYNSLYFKIILILVIFMITVMCVIGTVLINSVNSFYMDNFEAEMKESFEGSSTLIGELQSALSGERFWDEQNRILASYSGVLGIDDYRNYYILDEDGAFLNGSDETLGRKLPKTANLMSAMRGKPDNTQPLGAEFADWAVRLENGNTCIIYVKDSMDEMQEFTWMLFSIILQALMFGLIFAIVLAFFLSRAITAPIQSLTRGAKLIAAGEFSQELDVHSRDEIGTLTDTFNDMKATLKSTLEEVSGEHQKLETIFTYLHDGVIAFTDDGRVLHINESVRALFGPACEEESFTYPYFLSLLGIEEHPEPNRSGIDRVEYVDRDDGDAGSVSEVMFNSRVLDVSFGNIRYTENNAPHDGVLAVLHDVTGRYELDKSRREFVANVSHEMRTPLTSIKGACETILGSTDMPEDTRQFFLQMAVDECDRMTRIVSDLLVLSRLDNKRTQWTISRFSADAALRHLIEVMRVDAESHNHTLVYAPRGTLPEITADKERIEQVLINILSNAIKYTPDGGRIQLSAAASQSLIEIRVSDNGIGIPSDDLPHLFERFYRVEKSRTSETGGTGLGLAIAKEIVEAHGGAIGIESTPGAGTTVILRLPLETRLKTVS